MRAASRRTGSVAFCSTLAARKQNTEGGNKDSGSSLFAAKQTSEEVWTRQPADSLTRAIPRAQTWTGWIWLSASLPFALLLQAMWERAYWVALDNSKVGPVQWSWSAVVIVDDLRPERCYFLSVLASGHPDSATTTALVASSPPAKRNNAQSGTGGVWRCLCAAQPRPADLLHGPAPITEDPRGPGTRTPQAD